MIFQFYSSLVFFFSNNLSLGQFCCSAWEVVAACSNYAVARQLSPGNFWTHLIIVSPQNVRHPGHSIFATFAIQILGGGGVCKSAPRGPQTPWTDPRGSHNRTILGGLDPCTKINWTPGCRLAPKTISSKMQRVDPLLQIVAGCFDLFESRRGAF